MMLYRAVFDCPVTLRPYVKKLSAVAKISERSSEFMESICGQEQLVNNGGSLVTVQL